MDVSTIKAADQSRMVLAVSVGIVLSLILGFGAFTQQLFVNGVMGEADNFYEAVTPNGFMQPQSFYDWILSIYTVWHLPLSIVACFIAFRRVTTRQVFLSLTLGVFTVLVVVDTGYAVAIPENRSLLVESYLSNLLGSPIIALFLCLLLMAAKKVPDILPIKPALACAIVPIVIGAAAFVVLFIIVKNLFWVTTSEISALMVPPVSGSYSTSKVEGDVEDKFGLFLNSRLPPEKLSWKGSASNFGMGIANLNSRAAVSVYLLDGCPAVKTNDVLKMLRNPVFSARDVSVVGLGIDDGLAELSIHSVRGSGGYWRSTSEETSMFWIEAGSDKDAFDLTSFVSNKVGVSHLEWGGDVIYRIDAFAIRDRKLASRTFSVRADDLVGTVTVNPAADMDLFKSMVCKSITHEGGRYTSVSPLVTVFLRVSYPERRTMSDIRRPHETYMRGLNGWLYTDNVGASEIGNYVNAGSLSFISMQGKLEELFIDHEPVETRRSSWIYMQDGELSGAVDGSMLKLEGKTNVAGLDGGRLTKTRWERIELAVKSLIVSVPAVILFFLGLFWRAWRSNERLIRSL